MAAGFGVGFNGPLLVAVELAKPATPSQEYESQLKQAKALQQQLEQEQAQGSSQKDELTKEANALKTQQAALEQQEAALEREQQSLEQQADQLDAEQSALRSRAQQLQNQGEQLKVELRAVGARQRELGAAALRLAKETASVTTTLARVRVEIRVTQGKLARANDPKVRAAVRARLRVLERRAQRLERQLVALRVQDRRLRVEEQVLREREAALRGEAEALADEAIALARTSSTLAAESAALLQQKQDLEQQGDDLKLQAANLQTQAADLQTQQAQLEGVQQQASTQQQQAEQLKAELTQELTKAGGDARGTDPRLVTLQNALGDTTGVELVSPPQINKGGNAATFSVIAATAPASPATAELVRTLRTYTIPQATQGTGLDAFVGGSTASNVDLAAAIASRLVLVILTVIALSFLVLMAAYRSLIVPAQAAVANVLAVSAAFGVLTAVFQLGWGLSLVGLDPASGTTPIASYVPLMMFAVLFGLSMDYQVFLLSQVEHHRAQGKEPRQAVASGLEVSAPVIVAAALIMISVFGSFILNGDPTVKQFGVGLSVGVALAATMVLTLAPAILAIVGHAGWWLPERLGRALPRLDIEGVSRQPEMAPPTDAQVDS